MRADDLSLLILALFEIFFLMVIFNGVSCLHPYTTNDNEQMIVSTVMCTIITDRTFHTVMIKSIPLILTNIYIYIEEDSIKNIK
jgi:hypothetical protein